MWSTLLQDGGIWDKEETRTLVLAVALDEVTAPAAHSPGHLLPGDEREAAPMPLEAALQQKPLANALKPTARGSRCWGASPEVGARSTSSKNSYFFSLVGAYLPVLPGSSLFCSLSSRFPFPPRAGCPLPPTTEQTHPGPGQKVSTTQILPSCQHLRN